MNMDAFMELDHHIKQLKEKMELNFEVFDMGNLEVPLLFSSPKSSMTS